MHRWLEDLVQDLRLAVRGLVRDKAFTAAALCTLAHGVGATAGVFSVVNGIILRPLPFAEPDRLVQLYGTPASRGEAVDHLAEYRAQSTSFVALAGYGVSARYLRGAGGTEQVAAVTAERGLFSMLGARPIVGRAWRPDDPATAMVVAEGFWRRRLDGDPSALGRTLTLDGEPFTIVGVMPESFQFPYSAASILPGVSSQARTDVWLVSEPPSQGSTRSRFSYATGRLEANVSLQTAQNELAVIATRLHALNPDPYGARGVRLEPLSDVVVAATVRRPLVFLLGAVGLVLALACANLTNLALVRFTVRRRDIAVRRALGAGTLRLVRQSLAESFLLSGIGGGLGLAIAWWVTSSLLFAAGASVPRAHEVTLDWRVFLFLFAICGATSAALGILPAIIAVHEAAGTALQRTSARSTMDAGQRRIRDGLVVAELTLAFVLGVGAALLTRELIRLRNTDTGMVTRNVLTIHLGDRMISRGRERPFSNDVAQFYEIAQRVVAQLPGVRAAGFIQVLPLQNWGWKASSSDFLVRGRPATQSPPFQFELRYVTPGYFRALGIPLLRGRAFTERDDRDAPGVILINEALARRQFPGEDPIGRDTTRGTIVGIVGDVRQSNLERPAAPEIYYPIAQNWSQVAELGMTLVVSTQEGSEGLTDAVRTVIRQVNPNLAVFSAKTMDRVIADWLSGVTLFLGLMASFAVVALLLASTGTYGVISYVTASRTRELAIRVALGADGRRVMRSVLGQGVRLAAVGLGLGLSAVLAAAPLLQGLPVSVRPPDVTTTGPVAVLILLVALAACYSPAHRAATVNPMEALRSE